MVSGARAHETRAKAAHVQPVKWKLKSSDANLNAAAAGEVGDDEAPQASAAVAEARP